MIMARQLLFLITTALLFPLAIKAAGLKVWPSEMAISATSGSPAQTYLFVENPNDKPVFFEVYPDNLQNYLEISPAGFVLNPKENKKIAVLANFPKPGLFRTNVSVLAKPTADDLFKANSGVKIPLEITIASGDKTGFLAASLREFFDEKIAISDLFYVIGAICLLEIARRFNKKTPVRPQSGPGRE